MADVGPFRSPSMVADAVVETLKLWQATYAAGVAERLGWTEDVKPVREFPIGNRSDEWFVTQSPPIVTVAVEGTTSGDEEPPFSRVGRTLRVTYSLSVTVVVAGPDSDQTVRLADVYTTMVSLILVQQLRLHELVETFWVTGIEPIDLPASQKARTLLGRRVDGAVRVTEAFHEIGPRVPDPGPQPTESWEGPFTPSVDVAPPE